MSLFSYFFVHNPSHADQRWMNIICTCSFYHEIRPSTTSAMAPKSSLGPVRKGKDIARYVLGETTIEMNIY